MIDTVDILDRRLINLMQSEFPLNAEPFSAVAHRLNVSPEEIILRIDRLKKEGMIRLIGPVLDGRALGYRSTLAAMKVPESKLSLISEIIAVHPGISHCYLRDHYINLWFTLAMPGKGEVAEELKKLADRFGSCATLNLPAVRTFKIRTYFSASGEDSFDVDSVPAAGPAYPNLSLSELDRQIINNIQEDLPLVERPFDDIAKQIGVSTGDFLSRCRGLIDCGVIRRFGASVKHQKLGFIANGMACWWADKSRIEDAADLLVQYRQVSHCYERKAEPLWKYNLFAMIHADTSESCQSVAEAVSQQAGLKNNVILFSVKELKKVRIKYLV